MDHISWTAGSLCAVGGIMGFAKKRSVPSLVAGLSFAGIYFSAGYLLKQNADWGLELALLASSGLLTAGIVRGYPSRFSKKVPLMLALLGATTTTYYSKKYYEFYG
ncbi:Tmh11p [Ascoidea rubescens DSM 1968]|uniref:TMEM14-domain-containing protein n=1 Tax=Ascoidea rubescens DSM 1968 TaxID=1344418 RepID=A0A1D2VA64_9ASCO|nr:TMEM14-domain-containing protein [Ascoidea rubescens DSM 1968]ODV58544.1 TMEM14-domain-containing protein [Ascoidea rubescens DSM 1968]